MRQYSPECARGFTPGSWGCEWKQVTLTRAELEEVARQVDPVFERVESVRAVYESGSKRVSTFILENSTQMVEVPAGILRTGVGTLRLPSTLLERVSWVGDKLTAWSRGYGHGVGMSQYGAYYLAQQKGSTFEAIVNHYIHGVRWMNLRDDADPLSAKWNTLLRRPLVEQGNSESEPE